MIRPDDWGPYNWKYWRDPRNPWCELPSWSQTGIQHGVNTVATLISGIYIHDKVKKAALRKRMEARREKKVRDRARGVGKEGPPSEPSHESTLAGVRRNTKERFEVLSDFTTSAVQRIGVQNTDGDSSYQSPSRTAISTEK